MMNFILLDQINSKWEQQNFPCSDLFSAMSWYEEHSADLQCQNNWEYWEKCGKPGVGTEHGDQIPSLTLLWRISGEDVPGNVFSWWRKVRHSASLIRVSEVGNSEISFICNNLDKVLILALISNQWTILPTGCPVTKLLFQLISPRNEQLHTRHPVPFPWLQSSFPCQDQSIHKHGCSWSRLAEDDNCWRMSPGSPSHEPQHWTDHQSTVSEDISPEFVFPHQLRTRSLAGCWRQFWFYELHWRGKYQDIELKKIPDLELSLSETVEYFRGSRFWR